MLRMLFVLCFFVFISCNDNNYNTEYIKNAEGINNKELYKEYIKKYSDKELLTFLEGDLNGDNINDLIIIYKESEYSNKLIGIYKDSNKILMPIAIQVNHIVCDGYHVGLFAESLQENIFNLKK